MKKILAFLLVVCLCGPAAAQDLPAYMRADKYLLEATRAMERGDRQEALRAFEKFESLDVEPTPLFAWRYGSALIEHGTGPEAWRKGQSLLTGFVIAAGRDSDHYATILELLLTAEARLEAAQRQVRLQERLPDVLHRLDAQMVLVEGGSFIMGCTPEQHACGADEQPTRRVEVASFEIGAFEVTQELWQSVMGDNPSAFACPECPVETVSWDDVQSFLARLNVAGGDYRLPTEAEWEYAARGGQRAQGHPYAGSGDWAEVAWYYENSDNRTRPVGRKQPNELALYDLSGNVREWVQDCWNASYEGVPNDGSAWRQGDCTNRVIRGGSWYGKPSYVRTANRFWYPTGFRNNNLGFRLVRTVSAEPTPP